MPCEISRGSCSLCPYCATESCPHYHDHDNDPRYWVYATDRRNSEKVKNRYPNAKDISFPYVEFTITDGEVNWDTSVRLVLSLEEHKFYYYNKYESSLTYDQKVVLEKPWDEKLKFK